MSAFTILNHGTAFHREKNGELIAELGKAIAGIEAKVVIRNNQPSFQDGNYIINEGPGSDINTRPGAVNPFTMKERGFGYTLKYRTSLLPGGNSLKGDSDFKSEFLGNTDKSSKLAGLLKGSGWDDNIYKTLFILSNKLNNFPDTINMVGWSRGAVTCFRIATAIHNKIKEGLFPPVSINLFLIDPVVGGVTSETKDMKSIVSVDSLKRLICVLSMHENRKAFSPLSYDKMDDGMYHYHINYSQDIVYLPMPGAHSDQVQNSPGRSEAADIVWNLAYNFLSALGTNFQTIPTGLNLINSGRSMCEAYARLIISGQRDISDKGRWIHAKRDFCNNLGSYVDNYDYFFNKHHELVFREAFSALYNAVFLGIGAVAPALANSPKYVQESLEVAGVLINGQIHRSLRAYRPYNFAWPRGVPIY